MGMNGRMYTEQPPIACANIVFLGYEQPGINATYHRRLRLSMLEIFAENTASKTTVITRKAHIVGL